VIYGHDTISMLWGSVAYCVDCELGKILFLSFVWSQPYSGSYTEKHNAQARSLTFFLVKETIYLITCPTTWRRNSWHRYETKKLHHCHRCITQRWRSHPPHLKRVATLPCEMFAPPCYYAAWLLPTAVLSLSVVCHAWSVARQRCTSCPVPLCVPPYVCLCVCVVTHSWPVHTLLVQHTHSQYSAAISLTGRYVCWYIDYTM